MGNGHSAYRRKSPLSELLLYEQFVANLATATFVHNVFSKLKVRQTMRDFILKKFI